MRKTVVLIPALLLLISFASEAGKGSDWKDGETGHKLGCIILHWLGYSGCQGD